MKKIHILDSSLINKIAAGEVVERPSSVVKELTENSIDAGATSITIEIEEGGISLIRITDNGSGIEKDQIETAFLRHATSKLYEFDELEDIATLGFRGEALSSIASVSQVEMVTKTKDDSTGIRFEISGGEVKGKSDIGCADGTSIIMRNLFYNTPARRKFLKKASTEGGYVADAVNRIALGHPEIAFRFINNGSTVLQTNGSGDIKTAIFKVYGKEVAKKMLPVKYEKDGYSISGMVAESDMNRANRSYENFFIAGRYIKSSTVQSAVEAAYEGRLMTGKFPVFVLNMSVPANTVDVNVHPTKLEVRFSDETFIYDMIKKAVENALESGVMIPKTEIKEKSYTQTAGSKPIIAAEKQKELEEILLTEEPTIFYDDIANNNNNNNIEVAETAPIYEKNEKKINFELLFDKDKTESREEKKSKNVDNFVDKLITNGENRSKTVDKYPEIDKKAVYTVDKSVDKLTTDVNKEEVVNEKPFFDNYRIVGQIFATYWIIEQKGSMYLIDQHAAHERVLYEEITEKKKSEKIVSQPLLQPMPINVSQRERAVIEENRDLLEKFGFELDDFGINSYALRAVPYIFDSPVTAAFFTEIVDMLADTDKKNGIENIYDLKTEKLASMSCKAAVKGNNRLSYEEAKALIEKILKAKNPFNCPHGRPTIVELTKYEIEKMFKRVL
ncbi:MAG: DNA mismatch repair endonuclease MutL [Firmicutes bacterium]|nr:DNA mismatch repair endonuclease MutL [Bacillota bacterium]